MLTYGSPLPQPLPPAGGERRLIPKPRHALGLILGNQRRNQLAKSAAFQYLG